MYCITSGIKGNSYFLFSKQCTYINPVPLLLCCIFNGKMLWKDKHFFVPKEADYFLGLFLLLLL